MAIAWKGDTKKLEKLIKNMERAGRGSWTGGLTKQLALTARDQVQRTIREGRSPDGVKYVPLKYRRGKPLMDTRRLYNSFIAGSTPRTFTITSNVIYAARQNFGWPREGPKTNPPARPFMPGDVLPRRWERELKKVANDYIGNTLGIRLRDFR